MKDTPSSSMRYLAEPASEEVDTLVGDQVDLVRADSVYLQGSQKFTQLEQKEFEEESPMRRRKPPSNNSCKQVNEVDNDADDDDTENVSLADIYPTAMKHTNNNNNNNDKTYTVVTTANIITSDNKATEIVSYDPPTSNAESNPTDFSHLKCNSSKTSSDLIPTFAAPPVFELDMSFVCHITYPDGSVLSPLMVFNKMWRLRNSGSCVWPAGCCLAQCSGDTLAVDPLQKAHKVPQLAPGHEYSFSLSLTAPAVADRYVAYFRMQYYGSSNELQWFGERVCVHIVVNQPVHLPSYCHYYGQQQHQQCKQQEDSLRQATSVVVKQDSDVIHTELSDFELAKKLAEEWLQEDEPASMSVFKCGKTHAVNEMAAAPASAYTANVATTAVMTPQPPAAAAVDRWARELALLAEMGFTERVIPLLERHLQDNDDQVAGMELVISLLLARS